MRKLLLAVTGLCLAFTMQAQELPATEIKDLSTSKKVPFNSLVVPGKVTVVSFWATWCIPCKKEIKNISKALPEWRKQADFNYVAVSIDESRAEGIARTYGLQQGWTFPFYIDPNSDLKRSLNFQNVPYTIIIDKAGKVVFRHVGYEEGGENEIFTKIKELAAGK